MKNTEHTTAMEGFYGDQASHLLEGLVLSEATCADWLQLSKRLITVYQQCLTCVQPHPDEAARTSAAQSAVETAIQGNAAALARLALRGFLASPPEGKRHGGQRDDAAHYHTDRQTLLALEAMTDRCEDIADALLAAAHDRSRGAERSVSSNSGNARGRRNP